jgi:site-specific recombinase
VSFNKFILNLLPERWRSPASPALAAIDQLLDSPPSEKADFYDRALWIKSVVDWVRKDSRFRSLFQSGTLAQYQVGRLKYLLQVLDRNEKWKASFANHLSKLLGELVIRDGLCNLGMPLQQGALGEVQRRVVTWILPNEPVDQSLSSLLHWIFPSEEDADFFEAIDDKTAERFFGLLQNIPTQNLERGRQESLLILSSFIRALGLSHELREYSSSKALSESPFYKLSTLIEKNEPTDEVIDQARVEVKTIYTKLETAGVSVSLVYQLEKIKAYLNRMESLLKFSYPEGRRPSVVFGFVALLIRNDLDSRGLSDFVGENISLLTKRIVRTNSEVGEHYIARDHASHRKHMVAALGGGVITSWTVVIKILVMSIKTSPLVEGLLASLNYASSFVGIQLVGFSLASKQPANTAPAMAARMTGLRSAESIDSLVDEVVHLIRSQMTSVFGNVVGVIPFAFLIAWITAVWLDAPVVGATKAQSILDDHDLLFSGTLFFAAFTGVLLFTSSLIAGAADNWFRYRRLRYILSRNERIRSLFGVGGARKLAEFFSLRTAGLAGNISLGFLLGLTPEILAFVGLPIEVRHVTLAFGTVATALPSLEWTQILSWQMLSVFLALCGIGLLNVAVSFALAFWVAIRSQDVSAPQRNVVFQAVRQRFWKKPLSFFWPSA